MSKYTDITGQKFGRLTAISLHSRNANKHILWLFECDCGEKRISLAAAIKQGRVVSCGCHRNEQSRLRVKHGLSETSTYTAWKGMKSRVKGKDDICIKHYLNKGITICERWQNSFENFMLDMGERPTGMTLDRIDNNGNYEPGNCRWTTQKQQVANTCRTIYVDFKGQKTCLKHACQEGNVNYDAVRSRLRAGREPQEAFTTPFRLRKVS